MTTSPARLWWQLHPLTFLGAEPTALPDGAEVQHRLPRLVRWLDHVVALGADGLLLGPVFASSSHGYDTTDHLRVDPRLGDADDLAELVRAAQQRGVTVALDGVFNHVGRGYGPFQDVLREGPGSRYAGWFRLRWPEDGWAGPGSEPDYDTFEGHGPLVALDHTEPEVRAVVEQVLDHWAGYGVTAWRLDAAYAVAPDFLRQVTSRAREQRPGSWFLGEVIHGDYGRIAEASGLDAVTQYELWKAVWSGISDRNFFELAHALGRHQDFAAATTPQTFLGNHDVTRIATRLPDERHLAHAEVVLLTVAGVPSVYAGDELGLHGRKEEREGGDDAVRPAFPAEPPAPPEEVPGTFGRYRDLARLRREHPWLETCRTEVVALANEHLVYRSTGGHAEQLLVALSLHDEPVDVPVEVSPDGWQVLLGEADVAEGRLGLGEHGWAVLGLR